MKSYLAFALLVILVPIVAVRALAAERFAAFAGEWVCSSTVRREKGVGHRFLGTSGGGDVTTTPTQVSVKTSLVVGSSRTGYQIVPTDDVFELTLKYSTATDRYLFDLQTTSSTRAIKDLPLTFTAGKEYSGKGTMTVGDRQVNVEVSIELTTDGHEWVIRAPQTDPDAKFSEEYTLRFERPKKP